MIKDYLIRKKLQYTNSYGDMALFLICVAFLIALNVFSIGIVAIFWVSFAGVKGKWEQPIDLLLPFDKEERAKRFLVETLLNLFFLAIALAVNVWIMSHWEVKLVIFRFPLYGVMTFIAYFVVLLQTSTDYYYIKCSGLDRIKKRCKNAGFGRRLYEVFNFLAHKLLIFNVLLLYLDMLGLGMDSFEEELAIGVSIVLLLGIVFCLWDIKRSVGGKNEY